MNIPPYIQLYKTMILQTRRGASRNGGIINAKPIFVLSLIEVIRRNAYKFNKIYFDDELNSVYKQLYVRYNPNLTLAPLYQPFYYLVNDGYWHIKWAKQPESNARPSAKLLREYASYGYLDNALWDLLQDEEVRNYFENQIISYFLSSSTIENH